MWPAERLEVFDRSRKLPLGPAERTGAQGQQPAERVEHRQVHRPRRACAALLDQIAGLAPLAPGDRYLDPDPVDGTKKVRDVKTVGE